jgi:flavin reductase (DIM6/NTAB) family NADH-FMN oxidoreductase RutF
MTCSSVTSVTLLPPTLLVCLRVGSGTLEAVSAHGGFAVNLLHEEARHAAEVHRRFTSWASRNLSESYLRGFSCVPMN